MIGKNKLFKMLLQIVVFVIVGYFATGIVQSTFATNTDKSPNVIITVNGDGSISQEGSLFGDKLLYPSTIEDGEKGIGSISGTIRINNQYKKIDVNNIGLGLIGELKFENTYSKDKVIKSFLKDVKVMIEKGSLLSFNKTIIDYTSLKDVLYTEEDEYKGFTLEPKDRFSIERNSTIDLKYTLLMDHEAGNELQSVTANMPIYINLYGTNIIDDGGGNNNNDEDSEDNDNENGETITIQELVPLGSTHWAHDCIITLLNHGVIHGYPHEDMTIEDYRNATVSPVVYVNEAVRPEEYVTRAEAAVLLGRALGLEESKALLTGYIDQIPKWARGETFTIICKLMGLHDEHTEGLED